MNILERLELERGPIALGAHVGPGWFDILERLDADLGSWNPGYKIDQIKEKFGALRVYIHWASDGSYWQAHQRIAEAEEESLRTCEECGAPGTAAGRPFWIKTLCESCA